MDAFVSYIVEKWPFIFLIIAATIFACWMVFSLKTVKRSTKKFESEGDCKHHADGVSKIESKLDKIYDLLLLGNTGIGTSMGKSQSPTQLSDIGVKFFESCGTKELIEDHGSYYASVMQAQKPSTALDVEKLAFDTLFMDTASDKFIAIKNYLYNNPEFEGIKVGLKDVCFVAGIKLRDIYLTAHPEIDPNK